MDFQAGCGFTNEEVDDGLQRLALCCTATASLLERAQLAMRAGAARQDRPNMFDLPTTTQPLGILGDQRDELLSELREWHQFPARQVEQPLVEAVTHRTPAVLGDQHVRVEPPGLVRLAQPA